MTDPAYSLGSVCFDVYSSTSKAPAHRDTHAAVAAWLRNRGVPVENARPLSAAALQLYQVDRRAPRLRVAVRALDGAPPTACARLIFTPRATDAAPLCLAGAFDPLRDVLRHLFQQAAETGFAIARPPPAIIEDASAEGCGFMNCGGTCGAADARARGRFHLDKLFDEVAAANDPHESFMDENHAANIVAARLGPRDQLSRLPNDIISRVIRSLTASEVTNLGFTNRTFQAATCHYVAGLKLSLYPHQCIGLDRMRTMERTPAKEDAFPMPMIRALPVEMPFGLQVVADMCSGALFMLERAPMASSPRGGLICDEPGLGKTITGLSLILKTLGQMPSPPPGIKLEYVKEIFNGKEVSFPCYTRHSEGRYISPAESSVRSPPRNERIMSSGSSSEDSPRSVAWRRNARAITPTKFYSENMGKDSLPQASAEAETIYLSSCTLVLAPVQIVNHWRSQIDMHVVPGKLRVRVVRGWKQVPSVQELVRNYDVVIMGFSTANGFFKRMRSSTPDMFRVRFLRIILDEGHKLGASRTSLDQFPRVCAALKAERRWIMTGTPTPSTPSSDVNYLHPLLQFIDEPTYGLDNKAWVQGIEKPYESFRPEALDRLQELLQRVMIRTSKRMIKSIPELHVKSVFLKFTPDSAESYNELVMVVARNIITSDWFREDHEESLLNPKNSRERNLVINNLRRSCCFGGIMSSKVEPADLIECLDKLYSFSRTRRVGALPEIRAIDRFQEVLLKSGAPVDPPPANAAQLILNEHEMPTIDVPAEQPVFHADDEAVIVTPPLVNCNKKCSDMRLNMHYRGRLGHMALNLMGGGDCESCGKRTSLPFATPCCHIVCNQCLIKNRAACPVPGCGTIYAVDSEGVPEELIELQPAMSSVEWKAQWDRTQSSKMNYLMKKLKDISEVERMNSTGTGVVHRRKKVIVFSQFTEHLMLTSIQLKRDPELRYCFAELYSNEMDISVGRKKDLSSFLDNELHKFRHSDRTFILLMGQRRGSVGLDLSFAEHIFLLEPFLDASLEKQVVSRAHRMGARHPVYVERLVMAGSVEADVLRYSEAAREGGAGVGSVKTERENQKRKDLLLRLNYVTADDEMLEDEEGREGSPTIVKHFMQDGYRSRQSGRKTGEPKPPRKRAAPKPRTPNGKRRRPFDHA